MGQACSGGTQNVAEDTFEVAEAGFSIAVRTTKQMGWVPDLPDFRDRVLDLPAERTSRLPRKVDLRPKEHFPIYTQGHLGSCTANAIGAAFHYDQVKEGFHDFTPSRLFIYYNERAMEGSVGHDAGAQIRDGIKSIAKIGVCNEGLWPYDIDTFTSKPSTKCYAAAKHNQAKEYARVEQSLAKLKGCLHEGYPFVFGFMVYSSFKSEEVQTTGIMQMPSMYEQLLGGHAVMAIGYDDEKKVFIVRNSWGEGWGDEGYFYMPYDYMTHPLLVRDIWTIRFVEGEAAEATFPTRQRGLGRPGGAAEEPGPGQAASCGGA